MIKRRVSFLCASLKGDVFFLKDRIVSVL